ADQLLKKSFRQFTLPLLILHGTADKVTKPSGSKEFYERAGSNDKTLKLYEGHFHDLLADVGKQQVMADIQAWIDAHLGTEIPRSRRELRTRSATLPPAQQEPWPGPGRRRSLRVPLVIVAFGLPPVVVPVEVARTR